MTNQQHGSIPPILEPCSDHIFGTLSLTANIIYYCLQIRIISFNIFPPSLPPLYPAFVLGNEMLILFWFLFYFLIYQKFPVWSAPPSCCCLDSEETLTWIVSTSWMMLERDKEYFNLSDFSPISCSWLVALLTFDVFWESNHYLET